MNYPTTAEPAQPLPVDYRARNQDAYKAARKLNRAGGISLTVLETYNQLIKTCGPATFTTIIERELAAQRQLPRRNIQQHIKELRELGLIRIESAGNLRRKVITAFDLNDPEDDPAPVEMQPENDPDVLFELATQECAAGRYERGQALAFQAAMLKAGKTQASFFSPDLNDHMIVKETIIGSSSIYLKAFNEDLVKGDPLPPGGGGTSCPRRRSFFRREEPTVEPIPDTPATRLLQEHGVENPETLRRLAGVDVALIERKLAEIRRRPTPPYDPPGFLVWKIENHRPQRREDASSWSSNPPPDPELDRQAVIPPTICPTCGRWCASEWEGHCPRCEPELFEPAG